MLVKKPKILLLRFFFPNWELNTHEEKGGNPQTGHEILESKRFLGEFSNYINISKCVQSILPLKMLTEMYLFLGTYTPERRAELLQND